MGRILRIAQNGNAHEVADQLHAEGFVASDVDAEDLLDYLAPFVSRRPYPSSSSIASGCANNSCG